MANIKIENVIIVAISLIVISIVIPIGLAYIGSADTVVVELTLMNQTSGLPYTAEHTLSSVVDPAVITLLTVLLPILVVIGIIMYFIPRN